ncbi:Uncharacterised protein [Bacillus freudenreichii]|nr:Uncharacterised protein [Bacillus freudenreichii]
MDFILPDIRHKGILGQYTKMAKLFLKVRIINPF